MMHSLTKEEEASTVLLKGALHNVLGAHDPDAIPLYFSDDAVIQINERVLRGRDEITQRLTWIRDHTSAVQIDVVRIFFGVNKVLTIIRLLLPMSRAKKSR